MGLVPGKDYETGNPCWQCFGEEQAAEKGTGWLLTPKHVLVVITGSTACPIGGTSPNGSWVLEQIDNCEWLFNDATWKAELRFYSSPPVPAIAVFILTHWPSGKELFASGVDACSHTYPNQLYLIDCGIQFGAYGGTAYVFWGPGWI